MSGTALREAKPIYNHGSIAAEPITFPFFNRYFWGNFQPLLTSTSDSCVSPRSSKRSCQAFFFCQRATQAAILATRSGPDNSSSVSVSSATPNAAKYAAI